MKPDQFKAAKPIIAKLEELQRLAEGIKTHTKSVNNLGNHQEKFTDEQRESLVALASTYNAQNIAATEAELAAI